MCTSVWIPKLYALFSLSNTAPKRKRPQKPAVQVDDTEIKGMQPPNPLHFSYYTHTRCLLMCHAIQIQREMCLVR